MELLKGTDLNKKFISKNREHVAVNNVSFELNENEFLAVVGESGSGKSTLLKLIAGIEKPDSGKVFYKGEDYTGRRMGYAGKFLQMIFQDAYSSFDPKMHVLSSIRECSGGGDEEELCGLCAFVKRAFGEKAKGALRRRMPENVHCKGAAQRSRDTSLR